MSSQSGPVVQMVHGCRGSVKALVASAHFSVASVSSLWVSLPFPPGADCPFEDEMSDSVSDSQ